MEQRLGRGGARALLAATGSAVVALSIPAALLDHGVRAAGVGRLLPVFTTPIGLDARLVLALVCALLAAAIVWTLWRIGGSTGRSRNMRQARNLSGSFGWTALIRRVRGHGASQPGDADEAMLARRRRDRHPDAPPRSPLFASRDLPPPTPPEDFTPEPVPAPVPVTPLGDSAPWISPPRSPAPLSEREIAQMLAERSVPPSQSALVSAHEPPSALARTRFAPDAAEALPTPDSPPAPVPAPAAPQPRPPELMSLIDTVRSLDFPIIEDEDLAVLADRFERGVARRAMLRAAGQAKTLLDERAVYARPDESVRAALRAVRPLEVVPRIARAADADQSDDSESDIDAALDGALATLRRLTQQGRR